MPPEYSNTAELAYDWMIAAYFFLGGLSAGCFLFSVATTYWKKELRPLGKPTAILAPIILAVGMVILLFDLGRPERAHLLFTSLNTTSAMSWAVWMLNIFVILSLLYALGLIKDKPDKAKTFAYLGVPLAIAVASYTGMLLTQAPGRPLWHSAMIPVVFLNGALISGIALGLLVSGGRLGDAQAGVGKLLGYLVLLELGLLVVELFVLFNSGGEAAAAATGLLTGPYALLFLGIVVALGIIIPAALLLKSKAPAIQMLASVLVLVGVFTMRYVVVVGGQTIIS
ncbi:MAG: polysulfide reductase NrfD [bacterium]|nr:polysulfide reductase NrfD [bacterium]